MTTDYDSNDARLERHRKASGNIGLPRFNLNLTSMNVSSRLVKESSDVMFSLAQKDFVGVETRLREVERLVQEIRVLLTKGK